MKNILLFILLLSASCTNNNVNKNNEEVSLKRLETPKDSITHVDICFYPSFTNSAVLQLNRTSDQGTFIVDTTISFKYGRPGSLTFPISDLKFSINIDSLLKPSFIYSLRQDSTMRGWTDGMAVWIRFTNNQLIDSVYLGNVFTKKVSSILLKQIQYLERKSGNAAMQTYLNQLRNYL